MQQRERRQKRLAVDYRAVLECLLIGEQQPPQILIKRIVNLPDDAVIEGVFQEWTSRCFWFVISSAEFPVVPDGEVLPRFDEFEYEQTAILTEQYEKKNSNDMAAQPIAKMCCKTECSHVFKR
jgi:hypothetical protein